MVTARKAITRKDVAELAGVSVTVVSYVLNNNHYVSQEKRERVLKAVAELQYRPNNIARALKGKGTHNQLFMCDNISNEPFGQIIDEMDRLLYDNEYIISLVHGRNDIKFVNQVISHSFDGVIISSSIFEEKYVLQLIDSGIPTVLLMNREYPNIDGRAAKIYTGLRSGIEASVQLLVAQGRKNILYLDHVGHDGGLESPQDGRLQGFLDQMKLCGIPVTKHSVLSGYTNEGTLAEALRQRLSDGEPIDGIIGRNDQLACVALAAVQQAGRRIPEDIAIIGFDNSRLSHYSSPGLTSVDFDRAAIAREIIGAFNAMERGEKAPEITLQTSLVRRGSTN
ncbi:MAG: LacI family transcriptional regulator [Lachnospiraceae bacterium]|nr:LacI family transcriptional regulator [Lachnospiraceae bacterium]